MSKIEYQMPEQQRVLLIKKGILKHFGFEWNEKAKEFINPKIPLGVDMSQVEKHDYQMLIQLILIMKEKLEEI